MKSLRIDQALRLFNDSESYETIQELFDKIVFFLV